MVPNMAIGIDDTSGLRWATLLLSVAALYLCWPLWPALVLAAWTASLLRPVLARLERRLQGRRAAAAVLTSMVAVLLATPAVLIAVGVVVGAGELSEVLTTAPTASGALERIATGDGQSDAPPLEVPHTVAEAAELAKRYGSQAFELLSGVAGAASEALLLLVVYFAGTFVFMRRGPSDWQWLMTHLPLNQRHLERFAGAFEETGRGLLVGVGLTCAVQGAVASIVYFALGVPQAWVLGPVTGLAAVIPVVGSAMVWAPIALGLLLTEHPIKAAILLILGVGVIGTIDNLLRPVFARIGTLRLPTLVLFVSAFGGLIVLGGWGAILGPLVVRLLLEALAMLREDGDPSS
jgi:predicted PurR-regulated permease PerM